MTISELIKKLEDYKSKYGDVKLYSYKEDGRSSWTSPISFHIFYRKKSSSDKTKVHVIEDIGY